jgi:hypothetical protein
MLLDLQSQHFTVIAAPARAVESREEHCDWQTRRCCPTRKINARAAASAVALEPALCELGGSVDRDGGRTSLSYRHHGSRDRRESIRINREGTYRNHVAVAVVLGAVGQGFVNRVLLARRPERQFRPPGFSDSDGTPSG